MEMIVEEKLSLEAGAAYLNELLHRDIQIDSLPARWRERVLRWAEAADLQTVFTETAQKEDWKYTPMDFLRRRWEKFTFTEAPLPFIDRSFAMPQTLSPEAASALLETVPEPLSPWEALTAAAPVQTYYQVRHGEALKLSYKNTGGLATQFAAVHVPPDAEAEIWFSITGLGFSLFRLHLYVSKNSRVYLYMPAEGSSSESYHYLLVSAHIEAHGAVETYSLRTGGGWSRTEIRMRLAGEGASAHLYGATFLPTGAVGDSAIRVEHLAPHTESNQLFKSLVDAGGHSAFQGRIYVARAAQKTNAYQSHRALLISSQATAYSRPQLEIFADDVRCTHGVTTGFLQGDMLFYLQARGIPESTARHILHKAFLAEVIEKVPQPELRAWALDNLYPTLKE